MVFKKELSKAEILRLLMHFFKDEIQVKAIVQTLDDVELKNWVNKNIPIIKNVV